MRDALDTPLSRRRALATLAALAGGAALPRALAAAPAPLAITVYKSRSCGCCTNWVRHMTANGFTVNAIDSEDVDAVKDQMGVRPAYRSCHTGLIGRYVIEGHVPADLVKQLVASKADALGLAVPGMPVGSPGMEQGPPEKYEVLLLARTGGASVYARR
jgi:hypothetical protein